MIYNGPFALLRQEHFETWRGLLPRNKTTPWSVPGEIGQRTRPRRPSKAAAHLARQRKARTS